MKKLTLTIIISIISLLIPTISAAHFGESLQSQCISLIITCDNCTFINISEIQYPNKSTAITNVETTKDGTKYNYSFCNTSPLGTYNVFSFGDDDGFIRSSDDTFTITPTGELQTTAQSIASSIFLFLMISLTMMFGFIGFKLLNNEYLWVLGLFFLVLSLFAMVYDVWLGIIYTQNYIGSSNNTEVIETIFWIMIYIIITGFIVSGFLLVKFWQKFTGMIFPKKYTDGWDNNNYDED